MLDFHQRKSIEVAWDTEVVKGLHASVEVCSDDLKEMVEIRNVENDGYATITFPASFTGSCDVTVKGSKEGSESGTVTVK